MKKIWVLTMFPEFFIPFKDVGVVGQSLSGKRGPELELNCILLREFTPKGFKGVDASPYGGGAGMVMRADVLKEALLKGVVEAGNYGENWREKLWVVCPGPRGQTWDDDLARSFAQNYLSNPEGRDLVFLCGRYEGIDERFLENYVDEYLSLGDFILSGGEVPVMAFLDAALRYVPGVLGNSNSFENESFSQDTLEYPIYTRPAEFEGKVVPEVLTSGHHKKMENWRQEQRLVMTRKFRPDLLKKENL
jgi:tRNA (guanine37-N1)-methyltransferase